MTVLIWVDYEDSSLRESLAQLEVSSKQSRHRETQLSCFELQCSKVSSILNHISVSDCFTGCYYENTSIYQNYKPLFLRKFLFALVCAFDITLCLACAIPPVKSGCYCAFHLFLQLQSTGVVKCDITVPVYLPMLSWHAASKAKRKQNNLYKRYEKMTVK